MDNKIILTKFNGALHTGQRWCDEWDKVRKELLKYDKTRKTRVRQNSKKDKQ